MSLSIKLISQFFWGFMISFLFILSFSYPVNAAPSCGEIGLAEPGDLCEIVIPVYERIENSKDKKCLTEFNEVPDDGWVVASTSIKNVRNLGNTSGPYAAIVAKDSNVLIEKEVISVQNSYESFLLSLKKKAELKGLPEDIAANLFLELKNESTSQFSSFLKHALVSKTTNAGVRLTGCTQAQWRKVGFVTIYTSGGTLQADVIVTYRYVGTLNDLNELVDYLKSIAEDAFNSLTGDPSSTEWTIWFDRDDPSGSGDWELRTLQNQSLACSNPVDVECQTVSDQPASSTGENITCNTDGLLCLNDKQSDNKCNYDYKVRFLCPR
ncbi:MAG: hypothetical protein F6K26_17500 [Moorea sp. SIO2I5]|nr:hypothetical protein [Moorena sp. SIO2I5]